MFVELDLEGKDTDHASYVFSDELHTTRPPGPDLGADVVENRDAERAGHTRDAEIEIRGVYEHERVGPAFAQGSLDAAQESEDAGQLRQNLGKAHDRK